MNEFARSVLSGDAPWHVDLMLAVMMFCAAGTGYTALAISGGGKLGWRILATAGWTLWTVRLIWGLTVGDDPSIPPASAMAIVLISSGIVLRNLTDSLCPSQRPPPGTLGT